MSPIDYLILNRADLMPVRQSKKMFIKICHVSFCDTSCILFLFEMLLSKPYRQDIFP